MSDIQTPFTNLESFLLNSCMNQFHIGDLMQQKVWKTQDGRMTKKCHTRPGMHSLTQHFFVIQPSWVFQLSCRVQSLFIVKCTPNPRMLFSSGSSEPQFWGHSLFISSTTSRDKASLMWAGSSDEFTIPWKESVTNKYCPVKMRKERGQTHLPLH